MQYIISEESIHGEEASILRSLTSKRNKLDSVGNDVQIWELSPSTSPLPKHYGRGEHERFSFFSHSPIDNIEKPPSPITETLTDLKEKSSMRLLGQLNAIVNRSNSKIFGIDGEGLAGKHKMNDINGNDSNIEVPIQAIRRENNFEAYDETVDNFLDAPTPIKELSNDSPDNTPGTKVDIDELKSQDMIHEQKDKTNEAENDKPGYFMEVNIKETGNKNDTDKNDVAESTMSGTSDIWSESMELTEESEAGREGSPGSSPTSPKRGNFRIKLRGGSRMGNGMSRAIAAKVKISSSNGFERGDTKAKERVKSPRKVPMLQPIAESEASTSTTEDVSSMSQGLQIAVPGNEFTFVNTASHDTHVGLQKNVTPERTAGASNITVNDHITQQHVENTKTIATEHIEPSPTEVNTSNNDNDLKISAPGIDPSSATNTNANTLVNVLRQRVRSIRAADPITSTVTTASLPVGSPTPFMIVSPVGSPPSLPLGSPGTQPEINVTQVHLQVSNDGIQAPKELETSDMVGTAGTVSSDTPVTSSNNDSGSSSAVVEGFTPDGAPSTANTTTSLTSSSIHSQLSSSETSISQLTPNPKTSHSNLPLSNSEQISSTPRTNAQGIVQPEQVPVNNTAADLRQINFTQGYIEGSNSVAGIPLSSVTSGITVSVVGGRVIGPGGLPVTGPGGVPITVGLNGFGGAPRGGDLFLMQGVAGINLEKSLLGPEDLLAVEMHPAAGSSEAAARNGGTSGGTGSLTAGHAAAGASGGSPDTAAQVGSIPQYKRLQ